MAAPLVDALPLPLTGTGAGTSPAEGTSDARQLLFQRALQGQLGQSMQGEVMARLTDGSFLVKVGGNSARMLLPPSAQVGGEVALTLVALEPRPTFEVHPGPGEQGDSVLTEAGPALLPGPAGAAARAEPLVYLDGSLTGAARRLGAGGAPASAAAQTETAQGDTAATTTPSTPSTTLTTPAPPAGTLASGAAGALPPGARVPASAAAARRGPEGADAEAVELAPDDAPAAAASASASASSAAAAGASTNSSAAASSSALAGSAAAASAASLARPTADPLARPAGAPRPPVTGLGAPTPANARAAALFGKASLIPASVLPESTPGDISTSLSGTARALASVFTAAARQSAALGLVGRAPLLAGPVVTAGPLALAMSGAIARSGLFYESHVAQWAEGKLALAELAQEPQMRGATVNAGEAAPASAPASSIASAASAATAGGAAAQAGAPDTSAQLINLQLHTHEQGRVLWQGELFPGQPLQWEVSRDTSQGGHGGDDEDPASITWRSALRFQFPLLGDVSGAVVMVGNELHIQLRSGSATSATALRAHAARLESALAAAGAPLSSLRIAEEDRHADPS